MLTDTRYVFPVYLSSSLPSKLTKDRFEPLRRCSLPTNKPADEATRRASLFLFFPAGLVRGALSALGVEASVNAEVAGVGLPGVVFTIRTSGHK